MDAGSARLVCGLAADEKARAPAAEAAGEVSSTFRRARKTSTRRAYIRQEGLSQSDSHRHKVMSANTPSATA
ncbi:MAG: hypothetical protein AB7P34_18370, partial [Vicinamibacterales bacterium]